MEKMLSTSLGKVKDTGIIDKSSDIIKGMGVGTSKMIDENMEFINKGFDDILTNIGEKVKQIGVISAKTIDIYEKTKPTTPSPSVPEKDDFASFPSSQRMISGPEGNFKINDNDLIVGGTNLFDNKKTNTATNISGTLVIDMPTTLTVNVAGDSKNVDLTDSNLKNIILKYVETSLRDGVDNSKVSGSGIYTTPGNQSFK